MNKYDVIVLGSGPGGYVTAIRASQLGFKTAIIEKENLGGVCLNWGCIPTKALLKSAQVFEYLKHADSYGIKVKDKGFDKDFSAIVKRSRDVAGTMSKGVQFLMKKNKIEVINGYGTLKPGKKVEVKAADGKTTEYSADHIIIATGARSRELPALPQDGKKIIGYRQALTLPEQPKKMIIVGSGAIGIEFAYFYHSMGTEVTVVEFMPNIVPVEDEEISKQLEKSFKKMGINVMTSSEVTKVDTKGKGVKAYVKTAKGEEILEAIQDTYSQMTEDEVGEAERILFITPTLLKKAKHVSKITNTDILDNFKAVIEVPQSRFYTKIQLLNGKDSGEEKGGYKPASDGKKINFMIIHKPAVLQYAKHANIKIFTADQDQDGDFNKMLYRIYSLENGYKNKRAGVALSHQA